MKKYQKNGMIVLALVVAMTMMLMGCGGEAQQPEQGGTTAVYQVTVTDALGNPCESGVIVRILTRDGEQVAMLVADESGVVTKEMDKGGYTVELMFTGDEDEYSYDTTDLTLSAERTELAIILTRNLKAEPTALYVDGGEYMAYPVGVGGTNVPLDAGQRNYFLFTPDAAGTYEISVQGDAEAIGYYGNTFFVQPESIAEVVDNTLTVSVNAGMIGTGGSGTTIMVLGIDAGSAENATLTIERIGDAERTLADEPWIIYEATVELEPYTLKDGASLKEFDLTASSDTYQLVLNQEDGFYHLNSQDGPLVLVLLGQNGKYLDCFKTILDRSDVNKYFFDDAGEFVKKERYTDCLLRYIENMDENTGVYPLTEDLKYIIQQRGDHVGWFDSKSSGYLFVDDNGMPLDGINAEISWLFMCRYVG